MNTLIRTALHLPMAALLSAGVLADPSVAGKDVPFHGSVEGVYTSAPGVQPATFSASGVASHIGHFTFAWQGEVTPDASGALGSVEFTAANADKIYGEFSGVATLIAPPMIWIEEDVTITGGTGRFADATGHLLMQRSIDITTDVSSGSFDGVIVK